ncbi:cupredoxin domain-containing protein [Halomarina litorea]|uniref:cupredoxin domain-containing protein n=1 Tax=Halomarina litorea TaxID=2961595 RepID=UPI0020C279CE|nr:plastocyanin/azurin family copper-binding protein [Halomarina sp. BCD28]
MVRDDGVSSAGGLGRRRLLAATGAGLAAALAGCSGDDSDGGGTTGGATTDGTDGTDGETTRPTDEGTTEATEATEATDSPTRTAAQVLPGGTEIRMDADSAAWAGQAPSSIAERLNPTLRLEAGAQYTFVWENVDGVEHELYIATESDDVLVESESAEDEGETVRTTFTARSSMTTYYCEYHPQAMRGNMVVE